MAGLLVALAVPGYAPGAAASDLTDFHLGWTWTYTSVRPNTPTLRIADLDRDGRSEIVAVGEPFELQRFR